MLSAFPAGKNVVHQLEVTLEEIYKSATRKLALQKNVICEKCDGMHLFKKISVYLNVP